VHGLASGQKPSQAKCHGLELALAWLQILEAMALTEYLFDNFICNLTSHFGP